MTKGSRVVGSNLPRPSRIACSRGPWDQACGGRFREWVSPRTSARSGWAGHTSLGREHRRAPVVSSSSTGALCRATWREAGPGPESSGPPVRVSGRCPDLSDRPAGQRPDMPNPRGKHDQSKPGAVGSVKAVGGSVRRDGVNDTDLGHSCVNALVKMTMVHGSPCQDHHGRADFGRDVVRPTGEPPGPRTDRGRAPDPGRGDRPGRGRPLDGSGTSADDAAAPLESVRPGRRRPGRLPPEHGGRR
jgi:hypothetical protein